VIRTRKDSRGTPEVAATARRERCPTCHARRTEDPRCHRCGCDLTDLMAIEREADALRESALDAYAAGRFHRAAEIATRSLHLLHEPCTVKLLACSCLRAGDYCRARELVARWRVDR
jgi:hypothetical protein